MLALDAASATGGELVHWVLHAAAATDMEVAIDVAAEMATEMVAFTALTVETGFKKLLAFDSVGVLELDVEKIGERNRSSSTRGVERGPIESVEVLFLWSLRGLQCRNLSFIASSTSIIIIAGSSPSSSSSSTLISKQVRSSSLSSAGSSISESDEFLERDLFAFNKAPNALVCELPSGGTAE